MKKARTARGAATGAGSRGDPAPKPRREPPFPIVGVGASAGGLEAFSALLKRLPLDTGMGFVLVQHLDPEHESALTQLLARATSLPVQEVTHHLRVKPNHVYVIPPNTTLSIAGGVLTLAPRPKNRTPPRSIDFFLEALAADQRERAIGVILSGVASDGTLGLEAIKAEGGITFAQDESARYDSMPRSAVAAGCVDFVLSPEAMADELARIARHPVVTGPASQLPGRAEDDRAEATAHADDDTPLPSGGSGTPRSDAKRARAEASRGTSSAARDVNEGFKKILLQLRNHSGVDFSLYKSTTIQRRINRRMVLSKQESLAEYARFLRGNAKELDALYSDTLISVTSFFRNPDTFELLQRVVLPRLLRQSGDDPLRVWVLGCSTGQEAYSIAMAFVETADKAPRMRKLQVFATDLNDALLEKARHGLYARSVAEDLSAERLRRFFVEEQGGYRVSKALREMVVFARQNVISDPPFSRLDLISCRNLLIYFEPGLQKQVLPAFYYALKPGGFLWLGASESIATHPELFEAVDRKHKIYTKKTAPTPAFHPAATRDRAPARPGASRTLRMNVRPADSGGLADAFSAELGAQREADRIAVQQFAPPSVLITDDLQVLQFRGAAGAYLAPPAGKASFDVLKMARPGLMLPLRAAISKARQTNKPARQERVKVERDDRTVTINLEVIPLKNLKERCFLVVFADAGATTRRRLPAPAASRAGSVRHGAAAQRIAELETELAETRDYLQSFQERHEAASEELQASSEEVQSANEELQSINEELETSKEELESTNEELITINEEMANRNAELNRLNSDLLNIQTSAHLPIVLLGSDLTVRRFSAQAEKQFNLLAGDIGRPIGNVRHNLDLVDLERFITEVIDTSRANDREVQDTDGRWFSLRVHPYLTPDNKVDGAVLVLVDTDDLKRSERAIAAARDYADAIVRTARDPLLILNADLRVNTASDAFYRTFKVSPAESEGRLVYELGNRQWNIPRLRELLEIALTRNAAFDDFVVTHNFDGLGRRTMVLNARRMDDADDQPARILLGIQDITDRKHAEEATARLAAIVESSDDAIISTDFNGIIGSWNEGAEQLFGYTAQEAIGQPVSMLIPADRQGEEAVVLERIRRVEAVDHFETVRRRKDGTLFDASVSVSPIRDTAGKVIGASKIARDITLRKWAEAAVRESEQRYRTLFDLGPVAVYSCDASGVVQTFNRRAAELWQREPVPGDTAERFCGSFKLLRPDGRFMPHDQCPMAAVVAGALPEVKDAEVVIERPDGSRVTVVVNIRPLKNERGDVIGAINCFYDITERVAAERALRESDRRKTEFLAMLAHELRNPLAPIRSSLEVMRRIRHDGVPPLPDPSARRSLAAAEDVLERQVAQMVRLVDDLLDAGRISRGQIALRKERTELASVMHHVIDAVRPMAEKRGQELTVTLPSAPVYLDADPTRLAQIVGNLLNNASKFTKRGGHIWLDVEDAHSEVVIHVRDTGIGIAEEHHSRVFDMFMQVDTSLQRSATGLGIGLTLVRTLVEMHGGTVELHSDGTGHGSEFVVRLPTLAAAGAAARPAPLPETSASAPLRVLIVDDNRDAADMLVGLLQFSGHQTFTAYDGPDAVEAAARIQPDVILMDIGLPGLNGYEAARLIRQQQTDTRLVLVALTGWGQDEDRRRSEEAGFDAHLVKPVDVLVLEKLIGKLAARRQEEHGRRDVIDESAIGNR